MRFRAFLLAAQFPGQDHTTVLDSTVAAAVAAEEAGFDDVRVVEHHFMSYGICPCTITLAGYLLGATRRVAVGTAVSVLSTQHPVALAEQAALGSLINARAIATRCCWPPESSLDMCLPRSPSPTCSNARRAGLRRSRIPA